VEAPPALALQYRPEALGKTSISPVHALCWISGAIVFVQPSTGVSLISINGGYRNRAKYAIQPVSESAMAPSSGPRSRGREAIGRAGSSGKRPAGKSAVLGPNNQTAVRLVLGDHIQ